MTPPEPPTARAPDAHSTQPHSRTSSTLPHPPHPSQPTPSRKAVLFCPFALLIGVAADGEVEQAMAAARAQQLGKRKMAMRAYSIEAPNLGEVAGKAWHSMGSGVCSSSPICSTSPERERETWSPRMRARSLSGSRSRSPRRGRLPTPVVDRLQELDSSFFPSPPPRLTRKLPTLKREYSVPCSGTVKPILQRASCEPTTVYGRSAPEDGKDAYREAWSPAAQKKRDNERARSARSTTQLGKRKVAMRAYSIETPNLGEVAGKAWHSMVNHFAASLKPFLHRHQGSGICSSLPIRSSSPERKRETCSPRMRARSLSGLRLPSPGRGPSPTPVINRLQELDLSFFPGPPPRLRPQVGEDAQARRTAQERAGRCEPATVYGRSAPEDGKDAYRKAWLPAAQKKQDEERKERGEHDRWMGKAEAVAKKYDANAGAKGREEEEAEQETRGSRLARLAEGGGVDELSRARGGTGASPPHRSRAAATTTSTSRPSAIPLDRPASSASAVTPHDTAAPPAHGPAATTGTSALRPAPTPVAILSKCRYSFAQSPSLLSSWPLTTNHSLSFKDRVAALGSSLLQGANGFAGQSPGGAGLGARVVY
ncbi:hypothetical protein JCM10207_008586 [Rhodosporidiobolus poonsookiae]